jgi:hypothetical protein
VLGGVESRLTEIGTLVVPPRLVAEQVRVAPPSPRLAGTQTPGFAIGDSGSLTLHCTLTGARYQPFAPSATAGERIGVTSGGVRSRPSATARSASTKPTPQAIAG